MAAALRIGVIGGSIAGCAAAVAGSRAAADVTVYERSGAALRDRGFGIVIPPPLHAELVGSGYLDAAMPTAPVGTRVWLTRGPAGRNARELAALLPRDPVQLGSAVGVVARERRGRALSPGAVGDLGSVGADPAGR